MSPSPGGSCQHWWGRVGSVGTGDSEERRFSGRAIAISGASWDGPHPAIRARADTPQSLQRTAPAGRRESARTDAHRVLGRPLELRARTTPSRSASAAGGGVRLQLLCKPPGPCAAPSVSARSAEVANAASGGDRPVLYCRDTFRRWVASESELALEDSEATQVKREPR